MATNTPSSPKSRRRDGMAPPVQCACVSYPSHGDGITTESLSAFPALPCVPWWSLRQVVEQLEDVGEHAHRRHVRAGARPLHDERRPRIALGGERDDVVAALRCRDGVVTGKLLEARPRAPAFERADVP